MILSHLGVFQFPLHRGALGGFGRLFYSSVCSLIHLVVNFFDLTYEKGLRYGY